MQSPLHPAGRLRYEQAGGAMSRPEGLSGMWVWARRSSEPLCRSMMMVGIMAKSHWFLSFPARSNAFICAILTQERQKVILQIAQNMCRRPALNAVAFDMPTVYIPNQDDPLANRCPNQIADLCEVLDQTVNSVVQNSLNNLKRDCQRLLTKIDSKLKNNTRRTQRWVRDIIIGSGCWLAALFLIASVISGLVTNRDSDLPAYVWFFRSLYDLTWTAVSLTSSPISYTSVVWLYLLLLVVLVVIGSVKLFNRGPTLSNADVKRLQRYKQAVQTALDNSYQQLYEQYLDQSVGPRQASKDESLS
eukprot:TRINITY_DN10029_c0_g1_i1.p1 TRINITY_DN10029_c0_g1~~TRINITY_DN10029_c0_g1_i1.p1  ORF type:complete len:303 (+),score=45.46 TRINITY_DN10029_c0_g1_i1:798-1706(+)